MVWAKAKESRDQIVLFPEKLDDAVPTDHSVRKLDAMLKKLDWSAWEATYDLTKGQPPIHPRIHAGVILYGLLKRIRTSRALEEALVVRMDFRWLAESRRIDHSTIAKFRTAHGGPLADLFVQIGLIAQQMGHLSLVTLGYDGTRLRASNRKTGTRTPEELRTAKQQLALEFQSHREAIEKAQASEKEAFDAAAAADLEGKGQQLHRAFDEFAAKPSGEVFLEMQRSGLIDADGDVQSWDAYLAIVSTDATELSKATYFRCRKPTLGLPGRTEIDISRDSIVAYLKEGRRIITAIVDEETKALSS